MPLLQILLYKLAHWPQTTPPMSSLSLIFLYSTLVIIAAVVGGCLPSRLRFGHTRIQLVMSLVSGLMLGVAIFHLLPHGLHELGDEASLDTAMLWLMGGLMFTFLLLRWFHFHQHDASVLDHNHEHPQDSCAHGHEQTHSRWAWLGVFGGLAVHTIIDGVALGAAIAVEHEAHPEMLLAGVGVFLAIILHKPLDALTIASLMQRGKWPLKMQILVIALFASMLPLGAIFFHLAQSVLDHAHTLVGFALLFSTGVFLCISLSDLLPELHFHSHDRVKLTIFLLVGILAAYSITMLEPTYHVHAH